MTPKKKSGFEIALFALMLLPILYACMIGAVIYSDEIIISKGSPDIMKWVPAWFNAIFDLSWLTSLTFFTITDSTLTFVGIGAFVWFIFFAWWVTSQKNLIAGKEHGTAKWAKPSDLKDLHAETIKKNEIKEIRKLKWRLGAYFTKRKKIKEIKNFFKKEKAAAKKEKFRYTKDHYKTLLKELSADEANRITEIKEKDIQISKEEYTKELIRLANKYDNADMLFTKTERICMYNYRLNNNTLIIGGSGSGKTRGYVMPNILQAHSSYIITDPKGEILAKSGHFLKNVKGYQIRVLNLDEKTKSDYYNPFKYIHPERAGYEERVLTLIETIIINTDGGEKRNSSDPFWEKAERLFLQAIFFFVIDAFKEKEQNMSTVMELIAWLKIEEEQDKMNSTLDAFVDWMQKPVEQGGGGFPKDNIGIQQYNEFRSKAAGKTAKSIVISAVARLAPFRVKEVKRIFSADNMLLNEVGKKKTAIFVVVPPTDKTYNFIAGMLFTQLFQELQYCATVENKATQKLDIPVRFILDEFANTCIIPQFVQILAYARSFGIGITTILQSLEQIKKIYEKEWGVVIDNCNTLLYLGAVSHIDTLEYISKLLGKATFDKKSTGRTYGKQGSSSQNYDSLGRDLLDPSEVRKIKKEKCILIVGGQDPYYSNKYEYKDHPNYHFTSDGGADAFVYEPAELEENENGETTNQTNVFNMENFAAKQQPRGNEMLHQIKTVFKRILTPADKSQYTEDGRYTSPIIEKLTEECRIKEVEYPQLFEYLNKHGINIGDIDTSRFESSTEEEKQAMRDAFVNSLINSLITGEMELEQIPCDTDDDEMKEALLAIQDSIPISKEQILQYS